MAAELSIAWQDGDATHENVLYLHDADAARVRAALQLTVSGAIDGAALGIPVAGAPQELPLEAFIRRPNRWLTVKPGVGRWYPARLLPDAKCRWPSFRVLAVDSSTLTVQTDHPLAGIETRISIEDVEPLAASPAFDEAPVIEKVGHWLADGPGIEAVRSDAEPDFFSPSLLEREDESDDTRFYAMARLVQHIDGHCRAALASRYARLAPPRPVVLDLMSSWVTHLPDSLTLAGLTCAGMNEQELSANPRATATVCRDLNAHPVLPFEDDSFDLAICSVSVEYLTQPDAVFAEVARVLAPGAAFANGFSERWFPTKIIGIWAALHPFERLRLVTELYRRCQAFEGLATWTRHGAPRPPDDDHAAQNPAGDPAYVAWGCRSGGQ